MDGNVCLTVTEGLPCLGPVTRSGCGALCPRYARGCYGCFGPKENANVASLVSQWQATGVADREATALLRNVTAWAPAFRHASSRHENAND